MKPVAARLGTACLVLLLASCATPPSPAPEQGWETHRRQLEAMERWQAEGKLALRSPTQSESASFQWRQQDEQTRIELSGPLGANATILNSDGQQLEILQGSERSVWDLTDPRTLAEDSGWYLPLEALPYWLRGVPAPQYPVEQLELADQRLVLLAQAGWTVSYEEYAGFDGFALPTRLQIRGQGRSVRLIIRRWSPGSLP